MQTEPEWLALAEAGDRVRITEVDGERLVGAKQNRDQGWK